jgi:hypothetical protein
MEARLHAIGWRATLEERGPFYWGTVEGLAEMGRDRDSAIEDIGVGAEREPLRVIPG